jgi:uncharacterized protein YndB with AHSA1/START domain
MDKPHFVYVTYIRTTPEKVWQALIDGSITPHYWFGYRVDVSGERMTAHNPGGKLA